MALKARIHPGLFLGAKVSQEIPVPHPCGLVLEGGGLRGIYTSGVLRALHDLGLGFSAVIGTSMGACNGVNWVAGQPERNRIVNTRFVRDTRWFSWARLLRTGEAFGMDFIYGDIPLRLVPFDFAAFRAKPTGWTTSATDVDTGEAVYVNKPGLSDKELMTVLRAATSLPWIGNPVEFRVRRPAGLVVHVRIIPSGDLPGRRGAARAAHRLALGASLGRDVVSLFSRQHHTGTGTAHHTALEQ